MYIGKYIYRYKGACQVKILDTGTCSFRCDLYSCCLEGIKTLENILHVRGQHQNTQSETKANFHMLPLYFLCVSC